MKNMLNKISTWWYCFGDIVKFFICLYLGSLGLALLATILIVLPLMGLNFIIECIINYIVG